MNNIQLIKQMGIRWTLYRTQYEIKKKFGYLERTYPKSELSNYTLDEKYSIKEIKNHLINNLSHIPKNISISDKDKKSLLNRTDKILENNFIYFFDKEYKFKGWNFSNETNKFAPNDIHWSKISDLNSEFGDIKWIWDLARFTFAYDLSRAYIYTKDEKYAEKFWTLFEGFQKDNPLEMGVHYRCSQEMSFRLNAWLFSLYVFIDSIHTTDERIRAMMKTFEHYIGHIKHHINFSVEAVQNNHSISEATTLSVVGNTFSFIPEYKNIYNFGMQTLKKEITWQIREDGTYIQNSHNYHRLVLQNISWIILSLKSVGINTPTYLRQKANLSINFLNSVMNKNGQVPNYGMNDGSYIFPLTERDYVDYRPVLQCLNYQLNSSLLYDDENVNEILLLFNKGNIDKNNIQKVKDKPLNIFEKGGIYVLNNNNFKLIFKALTYKERPNQADNLHVELIYKGDQLFTDAGTFSYNSEAKYLDYFNGTRSHNTVLINDNSQMVKGNRFIWYNWSKVTKPLIEVYKKQIQISSKLKNYENFQHERFIDFNENKIFIEDTIFNNLIESYSFQVQWTIKDEVEVNNNEVILKNSNLKMTFNSYEKLEILKMYGNEIEGYGWESKTYGSKNPVNQLLVKGSSIQKQTSINTIIEEIE